MSRRLSASLVIEIIVDPRWIVTGAQLLDMFVLLPSFAVPVVIMPEVWDSSAKAGDGPDCTDSELASEGALTVVPAASRAAARTRFCQ